MSRTLTHLTNAELLHDLDERRHRSPVLEELCKRLEALVTTETLEDYAPRVSCPVCEADLHVEVDHGNKLFDLKDSV